MRRISIPHVECYYREFRQGRDLPSQLGELFLTLGRTQGIQTFEACVLILPFDFLLYTILHTNTMNTCIAIILLSLINAASFKKSNRQANPCR